MLKKPLRKYLPKPVKSGLFKIYSSTIPLVLGKTLGVIGYNVPPEQWVFNRAEPMYWNEAMVLQALLSGNDGFELLLSTPMIRFFDEDFLKRNIPIYETVEQNPNAFSSIWLKRTR